MSKHKYIIEKFPNGMHYFIPDEKVISKFMKQGNKRVVCRINSEADIQCAILYRKEVGQYILIGSDILKKLKIKVGSEISVSFSADTSKYQFDMPEEFMEVLKTDAVADKIFHSLTAGNQRGLIYLVTLVKSSDKRIERSLKIAEKIKAGITAPRLILK